MTHGSLFSGIGGFDLAAEWMGWENKFHCEWNEFGQKVLKYYWPESELFTDITKSDFTKYANQINVLTGGFPCQPYSMAGKRLGKEDDRHLWPEMLRVIREVKPRWVIGENVLGLVNWNGGLVFHEVQTDLEAQGYEVWPYVLPACSVNAPHKRDRVWFVANTNCTNSQTRTQREILEQQNRQKTNGHSNVERRNQWQNFPTVSPICNGDDGLSDRLDSITFSKWRNESIKAGGNAIVPQVVYQIFKTIELYEHKRASDSTGPGSM
jgi:DNA (cytosine-5)-methyltransferase 1